MVSLRKLGAPVVLALFLALQIWFYGFSIRAAIGFLGMLVIWVCTEAFAERVRQPWRDYTIVAAVSAFAGLALFSLAVNLFTIAFWLAGTGFALFWVWYWDRAESLSA